MKATLRSVAKGLKALVNPQNSEFWGAVGVVLGFVATATGYVTQDQWNNWWPSIASYVGLRVVSKAVKA